VEFQIFRVVSMPTQFVFLGGLVFVLQW